MSKKVVFLSGVSVIALGVAGAAAAGLPTGGKYSTGKGSISTSGTSMTVKQSSTTGIIDWKTFSVGAKNSVTFDNGSSGVTLNKVTGKNLSTIADSITATGSLYLMNSAGVIVSGTGKIVTGGTLIATSGSITTDASNNEILDIAKAKKSIENNGSITSSGGNVFLVGNTASNTGTITAKKADAAVVAASKMALSLTPLNSPGGIVEQQIGVEAGTGDASNTGNITGATAEVAAYSGEAAADSSKNAGTISALGAKNDQAAVWVISTTGKTSVGGKLKTVAGGAIETVGASVGITGSISAGKGGRWDLYADSITVDSAEGALIDAALNAHTNVSLNTFSSSLNLRGTDIVIDAPLAWSTGATLRIVSNNDITFAKSIDVTGAGTMAFQSYANNGFGEWDFADGASLNFGTKNRGAALQIQTVDYTLIYNAAQLQNINNNLGGAYALARSIDASGASGWIPLGTDGNGNPIATPIATGTEYGFFGNFDGLGHTIDNLSINLPAVNDVGLFGYTSISTLRDVGMVGGKIVGGTNVGALIGEDDDTYTQPIEYVFSTSDVQGTGDVVGGLIGLAIGSTSIDDAYATGSVSGSANIGGLIGQDGDLVSNSYATGSVNGESEAGGLIGSITADGAVSDSFASGTVTGSSHAGGLIGEFGDSVVTDGYWDTDTSGQSTSAGGLGLTTKQLEHALPAGFSKSVWGIKKDGSLPYLLWQAPNTGTRPKAVNATASDDLLTDETKRWKS
jgi:filamentous hemagglutinin family protein